MSGEINALAPHHLPVFITAPGEPDLFFNGSAIFMIAMVLLLGSVYFRLHALPEKFAHGTPNPLQFEIVAVLSLLALFTHNHLYWVAALLLALIRIPDFTTPLSAMADSLAKLAGRRIPTTQPITDAAPDDEVSQPPPRAKDAAPRDSKAGDTLAGSEQTATWAASKASI
jgi:hypothetical protein